MDKKMMQSVQVIIERLKTNPEDFFGDLQGDRRTYQGTFPRFQDIIEKLDDLLTDKHDGHIHRLWYLEPEEKEALLAAYKEARRARFEANVFHTLLAPQEKDPDTVTYKAAGRYNMQGTQLMQGPSTIITPQKIINESLAILEQEFDKEYAKNSNP
jgi:hypothetical protein